ncbi:MAG: hypothetical protein M3R10_02645, partial [Verrucomicrobiota bacterium]|nr:hypothetical protein [Verrucomicrobiota bacterium]
MKPLFRQAFLCSLVVFLAAGCARKREPVAAPNESNPVEGGAPALMQRALDERKMHRWVEAMDDCRKAIALDANDPDVHRGQKLFVRLAPFLAAIRELDARLAMTPDDDQLLTDRAL